MKVTLRDIAEEAGVSVSTVSRVLSRSSKKSAGKETEQRIWQTARELGYLKAEPESPFVAVGENGVRAKTIGCIYTYTNDAGSDPFFSRIGMGIQSELNDRGYMLGFALTFNDMSYQTLEQYLQVNPVEGVIVMGRFNRQMLEFLDRKFNNIVYAGINYIGAGFDEVICDGYKGAIAALEHLLEYGYERIGYLGEFSYLDKDVDGDVDGLINEHRYEAYVDFMNKHNKPIEGDLVIQSRLNLKSAYTNMKAYLQMKETGGLPDALYCANDLAAIGAMKAIKEFGLKIPKDMAVIGMDDIESASYVSPSLTTVRTPKIELGKTAVKILIDQIESDRKYPYRVDLPFELKVRKST